MVNSLQYNDHIDRDSSAHARMAILQKGYACDLAKRTMEPAMALVAKHMTQVEIEAKQECKKEMASFKDIIDQIEASAVDGDSCDELIDEQVTYGLYEMCGLASC